MAGENVAISNLSVVQNFGDAWSSEELRSPEIVFRPLLQYYSSLFGGREEFISEIQARTSDEDRGYVFIEGPSGFGKTSLLAQLVQSSWMGTAYHFFSSQYSTHEIDLTSESVFLKIVCYQLANIKRINLAVIGGIDLRRFYIETLTRDSDLPFLLVLDGLDEAAFPLVNYFPPRLGRNVYVLASARSQADRQWANELHLPPSAVLRSLSPLSIADISAILRHAGGVAADLADDTAFVGRISTISGGDPFYVRFLAEDVRSRVITAANVEQHPPSGITGYLDNWWRELTAIPDLAAEAIDLLGVLFVAYGPVARSDLLACLADKPTFAFRIDGVIRQVARFVIGQANAGYQFCHPRFKMFLSQAQKVPPQSAHAYSARLTNFCRAWRDYPDASVSPYILSYRVRHEIDSGDKAALAKFPSADWVVMKLRRDDSPLSIAEDLQHLITNALSAPLPFPFLCMPLLQESAIAERLQEFPEELAIAMAKMGQTEQALVAARLMRANLGADSIKALQLSRVVNVLIGRNPATADDLRALALRAVRETDDVQSRVKALVELAGGYDQAKTAEAEALLHEALDATGLLADNTSWKKFYCFIIIAEKLAALNPSAAADAVAAGFRAILEGEQFVETSPHDGLIISELRATDDLAAIPIRERILGIIQSLGERDAGATRMVLEALRHLLADPTLPFRVDQVRGVKVFEGFDSAYFLDLADIYWRALARSDPARALRQDPEEPIFSEPPERIAGCKLVGLAEAEPVEAIAHAMTYPPSEARNTAASIAFGNLAPTDPVAADQALALISDAADAVNALSHVLDREDLSGAQLALATDRLRSALKDGNIPAPTRSYLTAVMAVRLTGVDRERAADLHDDLRAILAEPHDAAIELNVRFQSAAILAGKPDMPVREIVQPLLTRDRKPDRPEQYGHTLAQLTPYLAPNYADLAEEVTTVALYWLGAPSGGYYALHGLISAAPPIASWNGQRAKRMIRDVIQYCLLKPASRDYYFYWCVARYLPFVASTDAARADAIVMSEMGQRRAESLCAIAAATAKRDPDLAASLLRRAIDEVRNDRASLGELASVLRTSQALGPTVRRDIVRTTLDLLNAEEPDKYGDIAKMVGSCAEALAAIDKDAGQQLLDQGFALATPLKATFFDDTVARLIRNRLAIAGKPMSPDNIPLLDRISNGYWLSQVMGDLAEAAARHGDLRLAHSCAAAAPYPSMRVWALIRMAAAYRYPQSPAGLARWWRPRQADHVLWTTARENLRSIPSGHDLNFLLAEFSLAMADRDPRLARLTAEQARDLSHEQVENSFGDKSRVQARIAEALAQFAPPDALRIAMGCHVGDQAKIMPGIVRRVFLDAGHATPPQLADLLLSRRQGSLSDVHVLLGSLVEVLTDLGGTQLVTETCEAILQSAKLLEPAA
ncbi:MAG TPA: hypothetical protein VJ770_11170 [Stellaceae bacterium]|nr:hypothetical protein [Stellaceae bacterium]